MYIDVKQVVWFRVSIAETDEEKVRKAIKDGLITHEVILDLDDLGVTWASKPLLSTTESLSVKENNGKSTVEVYDDEGVLLHSNGKS